MGHGDRSGCGPDPCAGAAATPPQIQQLVLRQSTTFWSRLRGLYGSPPLPEGHGLFIRPCKAVHTLGLTGPIDVVFLDHALNEVKRVDALGANRIAGCWSAMGVIELPPGYCQRHTDYLCRIRRALDRI